MRKAISPIKKQADKLALQQTKLEARLAEIEESMADSELYQESNKGQLTQLLQEQATLKSELEDAELAWFDCEEQMEAIRNEFELD